MTRNVQSLNDSAPGLSFGILAGTVSYGIKRAYLRVIRDLEQALESHGLTPPLLAALALTAANPGIAPAQLAAAMGHGRSRAAPLLDRLETEGLLERRTGSDRRSLGLYPTKAGAALLRRVTPVMAAHEARITAGLPQGARGDLAAMLSSVAGSAS